MLYMFAGFAFGLFIPFLARRFAKILPANPAYVLYQILKPVKRMPYIKWKTNIRYVRLIKQFIMRAIGWGIVCGALSMAAYTCFEKSNIGWILFLIWTLLLLYEIDTRSLLLPDMLTIPLLIAGFYYASSLHTASVPESLTPAQISAMGAAFGYLLPVLASFLIVLKYPEAFGGGDIKLLAAVGSWLGFGAVPILILASSLIFAVTCLVKHERAGAFGPSIVIATLALVFFDNLFMIIP